LLPSGTAPTAGIVTGDEKNGRELRIVRGASLEDADLSKARTR
jgi:hypothetical protein